MLTIPPDLYHTICSCINSKDDLLSLVISSRALQQPAESALHRVVRLNSYKEVLVFSSVLRDIPRFRSCVREVTVGNVLDTELEGSSGGSDMIRVEKFRDGLKEILSKLANLEVLVINDIAACLTTDKLIPRALFQGLYYIHLRVLRCSFVLDDTLLKFIAMQNRLEELDWTGSLISLSQTQSTSLVHEQHSVLPSQSFTEHKSEEHNEDPDIRPLSILRKYFPPDALPSLRILRSESIVLARALVPGRPVEHLWVPGTRKGGKGKK